MLTSKLVQQFISRIAHVSDQIWETVASRFTSGRTSVGQATWVHHAASLERFRFASGSYINYFSMPLRGETVESTHSQLSQYVSTNHEHTTVSPFQF